MNVRAGSRSISRLSDSSVYVGHTSSRRWRGTLASTSTSGSLLIWLMRFNHLTTITLTTQVIYI